MEYVTNVLVLVQLLELLVVVAGLQQTFLTGMKNLIV
jgi:hypothetical protein